MTRGGRFDMVWDGILAAERAGITPIKINTVVVRGQNEHEVAELARLTIDRPWQMRFLEIMPMEGVGMVYDEGLVTSDETQARLEYEFGPLEHVASPPGDPARVWRIPGAAGTIGFISPISEPFCSTCNRVRLSADGKLRLCLLRADEVDLRDIVRSGGSEADLDRPDPFRDLAQALGPRHRRGRLQYRPRHVANRRVAQARHKPLQICIVLNNGLGRSATNFGEYAIPDHFPT